MVRKKQEWQLGGDFVRGIWRDLKIKGLPKRQSDHCWVLAYYVETPSQCNDDRWYEALLFRSQDRTQYGIEEFYDLIHQTEIQRMATRIVQDKAFREALLSDDLALPKIWKRH